MEIVEIEILFDQRLCVLIVDSLIKELRHNIIHH
jgi:hypothetical protein